MTPQLRTPEHLSSIIECVALTYTGEAKGELHNLIGLLESDVRYSFSGSNLLAVSLKEVLDLYLTRKYEHAASRLVHVIRGLWKAVMEQDKVE